MTLKGSFPIISGTGISSDVFSDPLTVEEADRFKTLWLLCMVSNSAGLRMEMRVEQARFDDDSQFELLYDSGGLFLIGDNGDGSYGMVLRNHWSTGAGIGLNPGPVLGTNSGVSVQEQLGSTVTPQGKWRLGLVFTAGSADIDVRGLYVTQGTSEIGPACLPGH